jgi:hypothetical protein
MRRFFKSLLGFLVRTGNDGARFSQPKLQLVEQPLTLAYPENDLLSLGYMVGQEFSVPEVLRISEISGRFPQIIVDALQLFGRQPLRSSLPFPVLEATESLRFEAPDPSLNGRRIVAQKLTNLIGGHTPAHKQYTVKAVIISRFFRTMNLILHGDFHHFPIGDHQTFHLLSSLPP